MIRVRKKARNYTSKSFRPYAMATGQSVLVWNDLHEMLAFIYWVFQHYDDKVLSAWNAARLDQNKRKPLVTAIAKMRTTSKAEYIRDDLRWLVEQIDDVAEIRNDTVHAPLIFIEPTDAWALFGRNGGVTPLTTFDNRRAQNLGAKPELLEEFRWYRDGFTVLRDYALAIGAGLSNDDAPWPDRPACPKPKSRKRTSPRRARTKSRGRRSVQV